MYLFCYARSEKGRQTGERLLQASEGEWIESMDGFITGEPALRVDCAIVLILPVEAAVRILSDKLIPADVKYPIICMSADGTYAMLLKHRGYNTYELFSKMCDAIGCTPLSSPRDKAELAADLMKAVRNYSMKADDGELLKKISEHVRDGGNVAVYSDMPLLLSEPSLDTLSFSTFTYRANQRRELRLAYQSACDSDEYSVFITNTTLPDLPNKGKCLKLIPCTVAVGVEFNGRVDSEYASKTIRDILISHEIDPKSVFTVAASAMMRSNEAVLKAAEDLGCYVTSFDSRVLGAVRLPLKTGYTPEKQGADTCTAAACLAADNNISTLIRRAGGTGGVVISAISRRGEIRLT